jgi:NitT/TauT family transport system substrate-binding protein
MELAGRVAIVTGSGKGMGPSIAETLAREGADLMLCGRDLAPLEKVSERVRTLGRCAFVASCDVCKSADVEAMVTHTLRMLGGRIDILVNAAGGTGPVERSTIDTAPDEFDDVVVAMLAGHASAETALKFSLDFIMFGPNSPFVYADENGYFREAGLAVRIDPSSGSGDAINRLASGAYDIGYADVSTLIEFAAKNPSSAPKIVLFIQDRTPSTILYRKQKGISKPKDLEGHSLGSGATDAGARMFPTFAHLNNVDVGKVDRKLVDFRLRDSMFAQGNFDAIIAYADSMLNVRTLGLDISEVGRLDYADWGLNFYGNAMIASRQIIDSNPEAVRGAVQAVAKAWRDAARDQKPIIDALLKRNNLAKREVDLERLQFIIKNQVVSPFTRANGIGAVDQKKLDDNLKLVGEGFNLASVPSRADIFDDRFLPPVGTRKFAD